MLSVPQRKKVLISLRNNKICLKMSSELDVRKENRKREPRSVSNEVTKSDSEIRIDEVTEKPRIGRGASLASKSVLNAPANRSTSTYCKRSNRIASAATRANTLSGTNREKYNQIRMDQLDDMLKLRERLAEAGPDLHQEKQEDSSVLVDESEGLKLLDEYQRRLSQMLVWVSMEENLHLYSPGKHAQEPKSITREELTSHPTDQPEQLDGLKRPVSIERASHGKRPSKLPATWNKSIDISKMIKQEPQTQQVSYFNERETPKACRLRDKVRELSKSIEPDIAYINKKIDEIASMGLNIDYETAFRTNEEQLINAELTALKSVGWTEQFYRKIERGEHITIDEIDKIDSLVKDILFMSKLSKPLRFEVLKNAKLRNYLPDEYVFKQGEPGKSMFVIIIGSVNVLVNGKNPRNGETSEYVGPAHQVVANIRQGGTFGELALIKLPQPELRTYKATMEKLKLTLNARGVALLKDYMLAQRTFERQVKEGKVYFFSKVELMREYMQRGAAEFSKMMRILVPYKSSELRSASIKVAERSCMIEISGEFFHSNIVPRIKDDLVDKMRFLSSQLFFAVAAASARTTQNSACCRSLSVSRTRSSPSASRSSDRETCPSRCSSSAKATATWSTPRERSP